MADPFTPLPGAPTPRRAEPARRPARQIVATYDYRDEAGVLRYQVVRYQPKDFRQRRPDGKGAWAWGRGKAVAALYRLPELLAAPAASWIYVVEGEKDADRLAELGAVATTASGGAQWSADFGRYLAGRRVVILPDNDETGQVHAARVAAAITGTAADVRVLPLPGLPDKGDVSDWLDAGGTLAMLDDRASGTSLFEAEAATAVAAGARGAGGAGDDEPDFIIVPAAPFDTAKTFLAREFSAGETPLLRCHRGEFHAWNGAAYLGRPPADLTAALYGFLDRCRTQTAAGMRAVKPKRAMVDDTLDALKAACHLPGEIEAPTWLDHVPDLEARDILACGNGLLHMPTRDLLPHSPLFYTHSAVDYDFAPGVPEPAAWLGFLGQLWGHDPKSIATLQEMFGYLLGPDTAQQKGFLLVGPKRAGKGVIGRVLAALIGPANVVAPTLAGLGTNFGLAPLIGKRLALISDARLGGRADQQAIAERLLSIIGEDALTVDRKYLPAWTGALQTRFVVLSNELPRLSDASGALVSRFIVLMLTESFYGREDPGLAATLLRELPAILNWAIAGRSRLFTRGHFVQPRSANEAVEQLEELGSPIRAFIRAACELGAAREVAVVDAYAAWRGWCQANGHERPGTVQSFSRDLRAAAPGVGIFRPWEGGDDRPRRYRGLGLNDVGKRLRHYVHDTSDLGL